MLNISIKDSGDFLSDSKLNVNIPTRNGKVLSIVNSDNVNIIFNDDLLFSFHQIKFLLKSSQLPIFDATMYRSPH